MFASTEENSRQLGTLHANRCKHCVCFHTRTRHIASQGAQLSGEQWQVCSSVLCRRPAFICNIVGFTRHKFHDNAARVESYSLIFHVLSFFTFTVVMHVSFI